MPEFLRHPDQYGPLLAFCVFVALQLGALTTHLVLGRFATLHERREPASASPRVLRIARGPVVLMLVLLGFYLGYLTLNRLQPSYLQFLTDWEAAITKAWLVSAIAIATYAGARLLDSLVTEYGQQLAERTETQLDDNLLRTTKRILPFVVYAIGALVALDSLGVSIAPLLAGLGIAGLAVALAIQPSLHNFLSGTYIVAENILEEGDYIELEGGLSGYVSDVGWRSTKLRSMMNNTVVIPNSKLVDSVITNLYTPTPAMNIIVYGGVSFDSDLAAVERIAVAASADVIEGSEHAVKSVEPFFGFEEFGESNVTFWVFIQATDRIGSFILTSELVKGIHTRFRDEGIVINYPVRKLVYPTGSARPPGFPVPPTQTADRAEDPTP